MIAALMPTSAAAVHPQVARNHVRAVARYLLIASALGLAWGITEVLTHAADILRFGSWAPALWFLLIDLSTAYWVVLLILMADRMSVTRWPWWTPYVAALLLGGVLGQLVETALFQWLIPVGSLAEAFTPSAARVRPLIEYLGYLVYCLPATLLYAYLRRMRQQSARLHALQSAHASMRRNVVESRLQRMQSQLEPGDLFATLERIRVLQDTEPGRSLRALDALINYLRRGASRGAINGSTLQREVATTRAWLELQRELRRVTPSLEVSIDGVAKDAALPPMILRPMVQCASDSADEGAALCNATLVLRVTIESARVRLELSGTLRAGPGAVAPADFERLHERIAMLYQEQGKLAWEQVSSGGVPATRLVAEIPYERADSTHC